MKATYLPRHMAPPTTPPTPSPTQSPLTDFAARAQVWALLVAPADGGPADGATADAAPADVATADAPPAVATSGDLPEPWVKLEDGTIVDGGMHTHTNMYARAKLAQGTRKQFGVPGKYCAQTVHTGSL